MGQKLNIVKISIISKLIYRFKPIPIKTTAAFLLLKWTNLFYKPYGNVKDLEHPKQL